MLTGEIIGLKNIELEGLGSSDLESECSVFDVRTAASSAVSGSASTAASRRASSACNNNNHSGEACDAHDSPRAKPAVRSSSENAGEGGGRGAAAAACAKQCASASVSGGSIAFTMREENKFTEHISAISGEQCIGMSGFALIFSDFHILVSRNIAEVNYSEKI
ncbi:unnamed protein product [Callosobruchus maculatus]|uniref:Uncharacterized protein n=1 Tax=Callosobruchus maculatus TaxID=64391 RepID=A0A653C682_CALMS|nr:unnamed protein product [Callosobruchus maculatus]